jgi:hypothetical protein
MSDTYRYFNPQPVYVSGKGWVEPKGYISDADREMMEAAQRGTEPGITTQSLQGNSDTPTPPQDDPWADLH